MSLPCKLLVSFNCFLLKLLKNSSEDTNLTEENYGKNDLDKFSR